MMHHQQLPPDILDLVVEARVKAAQKAALIELARTSFFHYAQAMAPHFCEGGHYKANMATKVLCDALQKGFEDSLQGLRPKLLLNMPPRNGKTLHVTRLFPSWCMGRSSSYETIIVSYNEKIATTQMSRPLREVLLLPLYQEIFPGVTLSRDSTALEAWRATNNSQVQATGIGGSVTGVGANLLVIDDPYKNGSEANSKLVRNEVELMFSDTLYTRLYQNSFMVLVQTRWHVDDLSGKFLKDSKNPVEGYIPWRSVIFRAEAEHYEYYDVANGTVLYEDAPIAAREIDARGLLHFRNPGDLLNPDLFNARTLKDARLSMNPSQYASLYQQKPIADSGIYFNPSRFQYYSKDEMPDLSMCNVMTGWDFAISLSASADDNVAITIAQTPNNDLYILPDITVFKGAANIKNNWLDKPRKYGNISGTYAAAYESHNIYKTVEHELKLAERNANMVFKKIPVKPIKDKVARSMKFQAYVDEGRVYLPDESHGHAVWSVVSTFVTECAGFTGQPGGDDDMVDSASTAITELSRLSPRAYRNPVYAGKELHRYDGAYARREEASRSSFMGTI
jgi:predicted phage terminase large subunit-like protein